MNEAAEVSYGAEDPQVEMQERAEDEPDVTGEHQARGDDNEQQAQVDEQQERGDQRDEHDANDHAKDGNNRDEFKAFVGGLAYQLDDAGLKDVFQEFQPTDARIITNRSTGRSRGFGFVWFSDQAALQAAIDKTHNTELGGRTISVTRAVPQSKTAPGTPADALRRGELRPRSTYQIPRDGRRDHGRYPSRPTGRDSYRDYYDRDRSRETDRDDRHYNGYSGGGGSRYRPGYGYSTEYRGSYDDRGGGTHSAYDPHSSRGDRHRDDRARGHAGPPSSGGYDARGYPGYSSMGPPPAYGDRSRGYGGVERHSDYRSGGRAAGPYDRPRY